MSVLFFSVHLWKYISSTVWTPTDWVNGIWLPFFPLLLNLLTWASLHAPLLFVLCLCVHCRLAGPCFYFWISSYRLEIYIDPSMATRGLFLTLFFLLFWLSVEVISADYNNLNLPDGVKASQNVNSRCTPQLSWLTCLASQNRPAASQR